MFLFLSVENVRPAVVLKTANAAAASRIPARLVSILHRIRQGMEAIITTTIVVVVVAAAAAAAFGERLL